MNSIIAWFAQNRVAANLVMMFILIAGALTIPSLQKEVLPNFALNIVNISVPYPGASPSEVEDAVVIKVERALSGLSGVKKVESTSRDNLGIISVEGTSGINRSDFYDSVKTRVTALPLPSGVETPIIKDITITALAGSIAIYGPADPRTLRTLASRVKRDLAELPSISEVRIRQTRPYQISIEVIEQNMNRYGISFSEISLAIKKQSLDIPVGDLSSGQGGGTSTIFLGEAQTREQFEDLVIRSTPDGGKILLRDVANVIEGFDEGKTAADFQGQASANISIYRVGNQDILEMHDQITQYVANPRTVLPEGIKMTFWKDSSRFFKSRMQLLLDNLVGGLMLVFVVLVLFLRLKLSFWVSLGIPIAYLGAVWLLPIFGGTLNMISLFAFILVLGVVVDDAIIVGENIYSHQKNGRAGLAGAISGAQEVSSPVIFAVLTTMVMFAPLLFLPGPLGNLIYIVPVIVISILLFSLIESLLILPAHLSTIKEQEHTQLNAAQRYQQKFADGLENLIVSFYAPLLEKSLQWRYTTAAIFIALFILCVGVLGGGWVKSELVSPIEADLIYAEVEFARGTSSDVTRAAIETVEQAAFELKEQLKQETGQEQINHIQVQYGNKGGSKGFAVIELAPNEGRAYSGAELSKKWAQMVGDIDGVTKLDFESTLNKPGPPIHLDIAANDTDVLLAASSALKVALSSYEGVRGINDSFARGKEEVRLRMRPVANELGVQLDQVALQVREAFQGMEVQRVLRGDDEVKVYVRYPEKQSNSIWQLENMAIRLPSANTVPLASLADVEYGIGPSQIRRIDGKRVISVKAFIDESKTTSGQVMADLRKNFLKDFADQYPGASWSLSGEQQSQADFFEVLKRNFIFAAIIIYALMATLFRSYFQPLMVMLAIPFGFVGALIGHMVVGVSVSSWTAMGLVAVSGVVINDNLVLIDYINRKRKEGANILEAIRTAGIVRFRPIVLTSVTTFLGLVPFMSENSVQAKYLIPMVTSLAFGVLFATFVTLLLIPALYHIMEDLLAVFRRSPGLLGIPPFETDVAKAGAVTGARSVNSGIDSAPLKQAFSQRSVEFEVKEQFRSLLKDGETSIPFLSSDDAVPGTAYDEGNVDVESSGTNSWNAQLEDAYDQGFEQGRQGKKVDFPLESDELKASWEAGWDDGYEAFRLDRPQN